MPTLEENIKKRDEHWREVMDMATKYGFLYMAYGGTATLATNRVQLEELGKERYILRQKKMFGKSPEDNEDGEHNAQT